MFWKRGRKPPKAEGTQEEKRDPQVETAEELDEEIHDIFARAFGEDFELDDLFAQAEPFEQSQFAQSVEYKYLERCYRGSLKALAQGLSGPMFDHLRILCITWQTMEKGRNRHFFHQGVNSMTERCIGALTEAMKIVDALDKGFDELTRK